MIQLMGAILLVFFSISSYAQGVHGPLYDTEINNINEYEKPVTLNLPVNRPASCPLSANINSYKDLSDKLVLLSNSFNRECKSNNEDLFKNLNTIVTDLSKFSSAVNTTIPNALPTTGLASNLTTQNLQTLINTISSISQKAECAYDIKKNGVLPVVADIVKSVTQLSILIGGPVGIAAYAGGSVVTSAMYLIDGIIKSRFNWKTPEDRKAFIDANCTYFDLRRELNQSGILEIITDQDQTDLALTKEKVATFKKMFFNLQEEFNTEKNELDSLLNAYLESNMPENSYKLYTVLTNLINIANTYKKDELKISDIQRILFEFNNIFAVLSQGEFDSVHPHINNLKMILSLSQSLLSTLNSDLAIDNLKLNNFLVLVKASANIIINDINILRTQKEQEWRSTASPISGLNNGELYDLVIGDYQKLITRLEKVIVFYTTKIGIIENMFQHEETSNARSEITVLQTYQSVKDKIYGKTGWNFFDYLLNNTILNVGTFKKTYEIFAKKYMNERTVLNDVQKGWGCQDALELNIYWVEADKSLQSAIDFLDTNKELFNSFGNSKIFRNAKEKLQYQSNSLDMQRLMSSGKEVSKSSMKFLKVNSIGDLMSVMIKLKKDQALKLKNFIADPRYRCRERFQSH